MTITRTHYDPFTPSAGAGPFSCVLGTIPTTGNLQVVLTSLSSTTVDVANAVAPTGADVTAFTKYTWVHNNRSMTMWYRIVGATPTATFNVTPSASTGLTPSIVFLEYASTVGWAATPFVSADSGTTSGSGNAPVTPVSTPTGTVGTLLIAFFRMTSGTKTAGPGGGFSDILASASVNICEQMVAPPSGSYQAAWTYTSGTGYDSMILVFQELSTLSLSFTQQPTTAASGAVISPSPTVQLSDNASGQTVTIALTATSQGILSGTLTAVTNGSGLATFSNLIVTGAGTAVLAASCPTYTGVNSSSTSITNNVLADTQALITAVGGNTKMPAVYDHRANVTAPSGVTAWADAVGTAGGRTPGPQVVQSGAAGLRPTVTATGILAASASTQSLVTAATDARFVLDGTTTPMWLLLVAKGAGSGAASSYIFGMTPDPTTTATFPYQFIYTNASGNWSSEHNPTTGTTNRLRMDSGTAWDASTRRGLYAGKMQDISGVTNPGVNYTLDLFARQERHPSLIAAAAAGSLKLSMFRHGSTYADAEISWAAVFIGDMTLEVKEAIQTFILAQFPTVTLDTSKIGTIPYDGSSYAMGLNSTDPVSFGNTGTTAPSYTLANQVSGPGSLVARGYDVVDPFAFNRGVSGRNTLNLITAYPLRIRVMKNSRRGGKLLYIYQCGVPGTGSPYSDPGGDVAMESVYKTLFALALVDGFGVLGSTLIDASAYYTNAAGTGSLKQLGLNVQSLNALLLANWRTYPGCVGIVDLAGHSSTTFMLDRAALLSVATNANVDRNADPTIGTQYIDGTHVNNAANALIGGAFKDYLDANPSLLGSGGGGSLTFDTSYMQQMMRRRRKNG